jgi:hypothetical protein
MDVNGVVVDGVFGTGVVVMCHSAIHLVVTYHIEPLSYTSHMITNSDHQ